MLDSGRTLGVAPAGCPSSRRSSLRYETVPPLYELISFVLTEVNQLQRPKLTGSFILYMLNRYVPLIVVLYNVPFWSFSKDLVRCYAQQISWTTLELFQYLIWAVFASLRVYALQVHIFWAAMIFVGSISPLVINAVSTLWVTYYIDPFSGCAPDDEIPPNLILCRKPPLSSESAICCTSVHCPPFPVAILARLPIILADIAVLVITWVTQYSDYTRIRALSRPNSLVHVLLRNGTIYFVTLTSLNLLHMLLSILPLYVELPSNDYFIPENVSIFIEPLNAILVSSFLTDLRNAAQSKTYNQSLSSMGTLHFRVVGSLGSVLPAPGEAPVEPEDLDRPEFVGAPSQSDSSIEDHHLPHSSDATA
ncbi:hypothetical protein BV20DRAFT_1116697 [Pilatotrama ljubarskyi]|nr:hypothetical protein BV20DRAFT_1116697 [Pilatotrama ljubarskyi]